MHHLIYFVLNFIAAALVCNAIPHLAAGTRGERFPTPFSRPRGIGLSSPEVNVLWGTANLFIGLRLLHHPAWFGFVLGFAASGYYLAKHFGRVRAAGFQP